MKGNSTVQSPTPSVVGLVCKREAAHILACSVRTIERLAALGALEKVKVLGAVRFRLSDLERIIAKGTV